MIRPAATSPRCFARRPLAHTVITPAERQAMPCRCRHATPRQITVARSNAACAPKSAHREGPRTATHLHVCLPSLCREAFVLPGSSVHSSLVADACRRTPPSSRFAIHIFLRLGYRIHASAGKKKYFPAPSSRPSPCRPAAHYASLEDTFDHRERPRCLCAYAMRSMFSTLFAPAPRLHTPWQSACCAERCRR